MAEAKSKQNAWRREAHLDATEPTFGSEALEEMMDLLGRIEDNWMWSYACETLIAVAARILSVTNEWDVQTAVIKFLERARGVAHRWLKEITRVQERTIGRSHPAEANSFGRPWSVAVPSMLTNLSFVVSSNLHGISSSLWNVGVSSA